MPEEYLCRECPRACGKERTETAGSGVCGVGTLPKVAKAMLHHWEEPCISGKQGSGAVFFSGCSLKCCYCQNYLISQEGTGKYLTVNQLRKVFQNLIKQGAHNLNLVNPTHYTRAINEALAQPLPVPVVYNTGGYDSVASLRKLEGKIQIYLTDFKYALPQPAGEYSLAPDYPQTAAAAICEMYRQTGDFVLNADGLMERGLIIRHLLLPGQLENTKQVIAFVAQELKGKKVMFSLMAQYLPEGRTLTEEKYRRIRRPITAAEYRKAVEYMENCGIADGYVQELSSAREEYIPSFDLEGLEF